MDSVNTDVREHDQESLELLQRSNEVKRQLLAAAKSCGIAFYRPHWKQHLFHTSPHKRRGFFAGNRTGKSKCNAAETVAWMLGERVWYKTPFDVFGIDHDGKGNNRTNVIKYHHDGRPDHPFVRLGIPSYPTKQLVVCSNWDKVHEIWTSQEADRPGKIWELLPRGFAKRAVKNHEGVIDEIYGTNGSLLKYLSVDAFKRNQLVAESSDWDRVSFDEPAPIKLWKGCARGLTDRDGQGDFTLTSLEELWIYDYFNKAELAEDAPDVCLDREAISATIWDNPFLSDLSIARFEAELDDDEKDCRLSGIPLELSGLIYKGFKRDVHVLPSLPDGWRDWHLPARSCILHCRVDTHPVNPHAVMFAAVGPSEIPVVCHEIYKACDADTLCEMINDYVKLTGCFLGSLKVEPGAWNNDPATRTASIASYFFKHNLFPVKAPKDLSTGILIVKGALKNQRVFFTPECRRTFWEFARYRYDPETGKPVDENDHMMENLYRLLITPTRWFDPDKAAGFAISDAPFEHADLSLPE